MAIANCSFHFGSIKIVLLLPLQRDLHILKIKQSKRPLSKQFYFDSHHSLAAYNTKRKLLLGDIVNI